MIQLLNPRFNFLNRCHPIFIQMLKTKRSVLKKVQNWFQWFFSKPSPTEDSPLVKTYWLIGIIASVALIVERLL